MWRFVFVLLLLGGCGAHGVRWTIVTFTSSEHNAGTDSGIFITLHGNRGSSAEMELDNKGNPFERSSYDPFTVTTDDIGELCSVHIRSDGSNDHHEWHLDKIWVFGPLGFQHTFMCNCWLDTRDGLNRDIKADVPCSRPKK